MLWILALWQFSCSWLGFLIFWLEHSSHSCRAKKQAIDIVWCCGQFQSHTFSNFLNQCWHIIRGVLWHSPESSSTKNTHKLNQWYVFRDYILKITTTFPRGQWVQQFSGITLSMHPANERWRYIVTSSPIGWAHTQNRWLSARLQ